MVLRRFCWVIVCRQSLYHQGFYFTEYEVNSLDFVRNNLLSYYLFVNIVFYR